MTTLSATAAPASTPGPAVLGLVAPPQGEPGEGGFATVLAAALSPTAPETGADEAGLATPAPGALPAETLPEERDAIAAEMLPMGLVDMPAITLPEGAGAEAVWSGSLPMADTAPATAAAPLSSPASDGTVPDAPIGAQAPASPPSSGAVPDAAARGLAGRGALRPLAPAEAASGLPGDITVTPSSPALADPVAEAARSGARASPITADAAPRAAAAPEATLLTADGAAVAPRPPDASATLPAVGEERAPTGEAARERLAHTQLAAVSVQAAGLRPARPAAPSVADAVSPASFTTLNATPMPGTTQGATQGQPTSPPPAPSPAADPPPTLAAAIAAPEAAMHGAAGAATPQGPTAALIGDMPEAPPREPAPRMPLGQDTGSLDPAVTEDAAAEPRTATAQGAASTAGQGSVGQAGSAQGGHSQGGQAQPGQTQAAQATLPGAPGQAIPGFSGATQAQAGLPSPPPRPAPTTPAQQLMPVLVTLAGTSGAAAVTVTLDPVELGRVEISVRRGEDQRAKVQVVAERPETLLLLLRDQSSLDRALAQAGVGPEGRAISFDLAPRDQQGGQPQPRGGTAEGARGDDRGNAPRRDAAAERDPTTPEPQRRRLSLGALDIAV